ncbi:hypothetical protein TRFO_22646 [Tritrichomonas foetus]|uniref:Uncharacterized protein n=1 Tax=Tritrichomonas foetus TaxID=1144522 RepID=A0A1J4KCX8_9EUKA|nr:hypothetical protein TRFO_22646 [Tritrichomonas foetus]|eukprot:OHT08792.1 hypothetical protein TRFO_22646 [Tritrichomonas foetus]
MRRSHRNRNSLSSLSLTKPDESSENWNPSNRQQLFRTLKRSSSFCRKPSSENKSSSKECQQSFKKSRPNDSESQKSHFSSTNSSISRESRSKSVCSAASLDLFNRSVSSLETRTHRTTLHDKQNGPDDIHFIRSHKTSKNYKPLKERYFDSVTNRRKFCQNFIDQKETQMQKECTFNPKLISKQTASVEHHDLIEPRKRGEQPEISKVKPVINRKSKRIAENLTSDKSIFARQSNRLYHNDNNNNDQIYIDENEKVSSNKIAKHDLNKLIDRLANQSIKNNKRYDDSSLSKNDENMNNQNQHQFIQNYNQKTHQNQSIQNIHQSIENDSSASSNDRKRNRSTKGFSKQAIDRLVENSVRKYSERKYVDSNSYKPEINKKSKEIVSVICSEPRDLFEESLREAFLREKEIEKNLKFKEEQEMAECRILPKVRRRPAGLNNIPRISLADENDKLPSNQPPPLEPFEMKEIRMKPFSFDTISRRKGKRTQ